jgi:ABC-type multidrug transport system fused ATPase/permease subunit
MKIANQQYNENKTIKNFIHILSIASLRHKFYMFLLLILIVFSSFLEVLSIGFILPLVNMLLDPTIFAKNTYIIFVYKFFSLNIENIRLHVTVLFICIFLFSSFFRLFTIYITQYVARVVGAAVAIHIFKNFFSQDFESIIKKNSSDLISLLTEKMNLLIILYFNFFSIILCLINILLIFTFFSFLNIKLTLISLTLFISVYFVISLMIKKIVLEKSKIIRESITKKITLIQQAYGSIIHIKINNLLDYVIKSFTFNELAYRRSESFTNTAYTLPKFFLETIGVCILATGSYIVFSNNIIESNKLVAYSAMAVFAAQRMLPLFSNMYQSILSFVGNTFILKDISNQIGSFKITKYSKKIVKFENSLRLKNVSFKYLDRKNYVFQNLNLKIKKDTHIGIRGQTGSGKTTLVNIILGILKPTSGHIVIDGIILDKSKVLSWVERISYVPQEIFLINGTIKENILFDQNFEKKKLIESIKNAALEPFVNNLPEGFDTIVGERGVRLSGGQKQRIGIARALYNQKEILVLDEATSALDIRTEKLVLKNILKISNLTVIQISHKNHNLKDCELILEVKDKKIIVLKNKQRSN